MGNIACIETLAIVCNRQVQPILFYPQFHEYMPGLRMFIDIVDGLFKDQEKVPALFGELNGCSSRKLDICPCGASVKLPQPESMPS